MAQVNKIFKFLLIILIILFSAQIFLGIKKSCLQTSFCGVDMDQYVDLSTNILKEKKYCAKVISNMYGLAYQNSQECILETNRPPGYPLFLSIIMLFKSTPDVILYVNLVLFFLTILILYSLLEKCFGVFCALTSILILLNIPLLKNLVLVGNSEIPVIFLLTVVWWLLQLKFSNWLYLLALFFAVLFCISIRQNTIFLLFPLLFLYTFKKWKIIYPILFNIFFVILWGYYIYKVSGSFTISTLSGTQLFVEHVNNGHSELYQWFHTYMGPSFETIKQVKSGVPVNVAWGKINADLMSKAIQYIINHPNEALIHFFRGIFSLLRFEVLPAVLNIIVLIAPIVFILFKRLNMKDCDNFIWLGINLCIIVYLVPTAFFHGNVIQARGGIPIVIFLIISYNYLFRYIVKYNFEYFGNLVKSRFTLKF